MRNFLRTFKKYFSTYHRYNPYNRELIYEGRNLNQEEIAQLIQISYDAQKLWAEKTLNERVKVVNDFIEQIKQNKAHLATQITQSVGKPLQQSLNEIDEALFVSHRILKQTTSYIENFKKAQSIELEPQGVILQFSPWNWPILYALIKLIPALVSGNSVVLKHSYMTPQIGLELQKYFETTGINKVVQNIEVSNYDLKDLMSNKQIGYISITGSQETGMKTQIDDICFETLIETLRFNGKEGAYISSDSDVEMAAKIVMERAFENTGQSDLSIKRIYVHTLLYQEFKDQFIKLIEQTYKFGDPMLSTTNLGPLAEPDELISIQSKIDDAVSQGATVLCGGTQVFDESSPEAVFYPPTVVCDVEDDMQILQLECQGPVVCLQEVQDDEQAIQILNGQEYGSIVTIFTKNKQTFINIASKLNSWQVYGNNCNYFDSAELPYDTRKSSGRGVLLSPNQFYEYVKPKINNYKQQ